MVIVIYWPRSIPYNQLRTTCHPPHIDTMSAINTLFFAFCTLIVNKFFLVFVLASIAGMVWALKYAFRLRGDPWFSSEEFILNISINLSLRERCIVPCPKPSGEKIADLRFDDGAFVELRFVYF